MAMSKSTQQGQFPIQCQLCQEGTKIKWKCLDCDLLMCEKCKEKIHPKFKTAVEHKIIDLKQVGIEKEQQKDISDKAVIKVNLSIANEYLTKLNDVVLLTASLDDSLWICSGEAKKRISFMLPKALQKVKPEGNKLKLISSFNVEIFSMAITPNNDLLLVTNGPRLKQINNNSNKLTDTQYTVEPLEPTAVHVTRENKVIIGAVDLGKADTDKRKAVVIVMSKDGKHETEYEYDKDMKPIFRFPWRITSTGNGNVFVVDCLSDEDGRGRVVVLEKGGIITNYTGHPDINPSDKPFIPVDITVTSSNNVIVTDNNNHTLHILNNVGYLLTYYNTSDIGILNPCSLSFSMIGQFYILYIGCATLEGSSEKSKLYKINLSGC